MISVAGILATIRALCYITSVIVFAEIGRYVYIMARKYPDRNNIRLSVKSVLFWCGASVLLGIASLVFALMNYVQHFEPNTAIIVQAGFTIFAVLVATVSVYMLFEIRFPRKQKERDSE